MNDETGLYQESGLQPWTLALREEFRCGRMLCLQEIKIGQFSVEVSQRQESLWVIVRKPSAGGFALRAAYVPGPTISVTPVLESDADSEFRVVSALGEFRIQIRIDVASNRPRLRCTTKLTPASALAVPFWPRDLYPLSSNDDPTVSSGTVHAAQRGLNTALLYLTLSEPGFGTLLYVQNLTTLNDYFRETGSIPDGCVGGRWPELGYQPPPGKKPLPQGVEVTLSDVFLHWSEEIPDNPRRISRIFLDLLSGIYERIDKPKTCYHNWMQQAERTLRDLQRAPEATVRQYGHLYLHPYNGAEYPDSMVQLATLMPIREYQTWRGKPIPLEGELRAGVRRFFDPNFNTLRRYLPSVAKDKNSGKDADEVDTWYLYHPLANLGRLALEGDRETGDLFLASLDYGIKAAHHFHYQWPVQFNLRTFEVITGPRKTGEPGQSDVGGLFAYIMIQAWELTHEKRYLQEAKKAIGAVKEMAFELEYQANIAAWGAIACLHLWRITSEAFYQEQSEVFLANFFHNALLWESEIGYAQHYSIFLGATCLQDGSYMALYECFETFAAFHEYLARGQDDLPSSVTLLLSEYCKYALHRAWYYYPRELPKEALAPESRNGRIDRRLAFPVEDLHADGQPAGQVGQEIYGSGAGFVFVTRSYRRLKEAPFLLFCEYPFSEWEEDENGYSFRARGMPGFSCRVRLLPAGRHPLPLVTVHVAEKNKGASPLNIAGEKTSEGHWEFTVPAGSQIEVRWESREAV